MIINNIGVLADGFKLKFYLYEHVYNRRWQDASSAFQSFLKLPMTGYRSGTSALLYHASRFGYYWSSTGKQDKAKALCFSGRSALLRNRFRAYGFAVRCIKCIE